jgi:hypothetical protein
VRSSHSTGAQSFTGKPIYLERCICPVRAKPNASSADRLAQVVLHLGTRIVLRQYKYRRCIYQACFFRAANDAYYTMCSILRTIVLLCSLAETGNCLRSFACARSRARSSFRSQYHMNDINENQNVNVSIKTKVTSSDGRLRTIGPYDILAGRHKLAFNNIGSSRFRVTVSLSLPKHAPTRQDKTLVIVSMVKVLRENGA